MKPWDSLLSLLEKALTWLSGFATAWLAMKERQSSHNVETLRRVQEVDAASRDMPCADKLRDLRGRGLLDISDAQIQDKCGGHGENPDKLP